MNVHWALINDCSSFLSPQMRLNDLWPTRKFVLKTLVSSRIWILKRPLNATYNLLATNPKCIWPKSIYRLPQNIYPKIVWTIYLFLIYSWYLNNIFANNFLFLQNLKKSFLKKLPLELFYLTVNWNKSFPFFIHFYRLWANSDGMNRWGVLF